ncbi:FAD-dependent oxidoreductase [Thalassoglobus sp. JC818]|uniref:FAD-dependent oxidoreductase n=1 Tax=Thalassoglobus sp. JC818 TaxID=3232136 RepID=UPI00345A7D13
MFFVLTSVLPAASVLVEAESFDEPGGWKLDTQFIREMGSPYLLAHGLGRPVSDAKTTITVPESGTYYVHVRTKDWVARWNAEGSPGRFQVLINGETLDEDFGSAGAEWHWQSGGAVELEKGEVTLALRDLTGFDGRCDAIYLSTKDNDTPPNSGTILSEWRRKQLNLPNEPIVESGYDLVVIGGGYSGMGAAIAAARSGCRVALIQDRPVLGGNGSSEVRVWAMGNIRRGKYPRIGEIVEEFADKATKSPGTFEEFEDAKKEAIVRAESNIDLFLNHHAYQVETNGDHLTAVYAFDTRTSADRRFEGTLFCDATGHGTIGFLAGADWDMENAGRMGMSNMWAWAEADEKVNFPETPWALDLTMKDFPYPRDHHGQWFWESGFDKDALGDAEAIRDWNLRAVYGAFNAMKNRDGASKHETAYLTWMAYIGGPRESRRLMGDVVLTADDITAKKDFPDGCVPSTWSIDLHYPKQQYAQKYPENPFISVAEHDRSVDRNYGYPVPYRCFYSRNIDNLFMAGRCISVTHEALGTVRVMKTCGMMGEVVGKAASICVLRDCFPRDVYERYWSDLDVLLKLPGKAYRQDVKSEFTIPDDALPLAGPLGPPSGIDPAELEGIVIDDRDALKTGKWTEGTGLKPYIAYGYVYSTDPKASLTYRATAPKSGEYEVRIAYQPHENRGDEVPVTIHSTQSTQSVNVNMQKPAPLDKGFISIGKVRLKMGEEVSIVFRTTGAGGNVHGDAVQLIPAE